MNGTGAFFRKRQRNFVKEHYIQAVFKSGNKDIKNDGFYKLWQALLYLHPGCPAVSQLSPPPPFFFFFFKPVETPVSVEMFRILILNIPFLHRWCRSDNVFSHVLKSWSAQSRHRLSSARGRQITSDNSHTKTFLQVRDRTTRHYL